MSVDAALPASVWHETGSILTFIVPAPDGCDLACPYCFIRQRGEAGTAAVLTAADHARFIREAAATQPVAAICIQGYEPLLPDSFAYTRAILAVGQWLGIPTSLVTNGTHLEHWVDALRVLAPGRISVSLDAASADVHDRQRRKAGAFASTVRGLEAAAAGLARGTELVVTSVLIPKRRAQLEAMPALLQEMGVGRWVVTALQTIRADRIGGPVGARTEILADLRVLDRLARAAGIDFAVDDEFAGLGRFAGEAGSALRIRRLLRPEGVYRLVPDGRCSRGADLLRPLAADAPRWRPGRMDAGDFLRTLGETAIRAG